MNPIIVVSSVISALNVLLGTLAYKFGKKTPLNTFYLLITFGILIWTVGVLGTTNAVSEKAVTFFSRLAFFGAFSIGSFLFYFSQLFPRKTFSFSRNVNFCVGLFFIFVGLVTISTPYIVETRVILENNQNYPVFGPLYPYWGALFLSLIAASIGLLILKFRFVSGIEKTQLTFFFMGLGLSAAVSTTTNLIIPAFIGPSSMWQLGPLGLIFWTVLTFYAIVKHHLLDIKIITTEILVGFLVIINLIELLLSKTAQAIAARAIILVTISYGGFLLIKSVFHEIRRREEMEEITKKLQEAYDELQRLDRAKTEFLSMASHQLRTPLTAIKGYVSMILDGSYGPISTKVREKLTNVSLSGDRLIRIIDDLLSISKIELGKMQITKKPGNIVSLVDSVYQEMLIKSYERKLNLLWDPPKEPIPVIDMDDLKIRQVVSNLVDNALKYTPAGSVRVSLEKRGDFVRIVVKDTGAGLDEFEKNSIFQGFTRGKAGINMFIEGSGLGLYVARKYIELHHGRIWAESDGKNRGSTFYVELPLVSVDTPKT